MEITISKKKYLLRFGIGFVRHLNQSSGLKLNLQGINTSMGMGLNMTLPTLNTGDPAALSDVIWSAAQNKANTGDKLTQDKVDAWLESGEADLDELQKQVIAELKEATVTKTAAKNFLS